MPFNGTPGGDNPMGYDLGAYEGQLGDEHRLMLANSAISPEVANARRYREVTEKAQLANSGFAPSQRLVPGLQIPLWSVTKSMAGSQYRPDHPRENAEGRPIKYETPLKMGMRLDVHPFAHQQIGNPNRPLIVTEGIRKGDAAVTAGWCAIALLGVWNWRGTNDVGGVTALPDWEYVAVNGRDVYITYDSDVMLKPNVHTALVRAGAFLAHRGARVGYVYLPAGETGVKVGLDDWLAAGNDIATLPQLARPDPLPPPGEPRAAVRPDLPPQDGAAVLDEIEAAVRHFVVLQSEEAYHAVALWTAHTHFMAHLDCTPRLLLTSPEKQSGKTRVLEVVGPLCHNPITQSSTSTAYIFRRVELGMVTLLFDEADATFAPGHDREDLRSLLNAGFARGASVGRCEPNTLEPREYATFAPVALCGIGDCIPETVRDRAVAIRLRRKLPGESVNRLMRRHWAVQAPELRDRIAAWAYDDGEKLGEAYPAPLLELSDRAWDIWEPLVMIADLAGGRWPALARTAAVRLFEAQVQVGPTDREESAPLRVLAACRDVFATVNPLTGEPCKPLTPTELAHALIAIPDGEWRDLRRGEGLSANQLSRWLRLYDVKPRDPEREGKKVNRKYHAEDFTDAWARYLPAEQEDDR